MGFVTHLAYMAALALTGVVMMASGGLAQPARGQDIGQTCSAFGVIEIGASGVKAQAYSISPTRAREMLNDPEAGAALRYRAFAEHRLTDYTEMDVNAYRAANVERAADAVKAFIDRMFADHGVAAECVYVVGSSAIADVEHAPDLVAGVVRRTGRPVEFVSTSEEGAFSFAWVTPNYRRHEVLLIDVGSSNTQAAYGLVRADGSYAVEAFDMLPLGTKTSLDAIVAQSGGVRSDTFADDVAAFRADVLAPEIYASSTNWPGVANRPRVYLLGGIVWAMVAHQHPHKAQEDWVVLDARDIRAFHDRMVAGEAFIPDPARMRIVSTPSIAEQARTDIARVGNVFTEDQLIAGAALLLALSETLGFEERDALFFSRVGRDGWRSQYLVEKLAGRSDDVFTP